MQTQSIQQLTKAQQLKNESFYTKKRCLLRKAEQIYKFCNSDVFIVIHKHDTDRVFSFTTNQNFELSQIAKLLHKDVNDRVQVRKIQKFFQPEIAQINHRIEQIQNILEQQDDITSDRSSNNDMCEFMYQKQEQSLSTNTMSSNGQSVPLVNQVSKVKPSKISTNFMSAQLSQSTQEQLEVQSKISEPNVSTFNTPQTQVPKITMFDIDAIVSNENSIQESSPLTPRQSEYHNAEKELSASFSSPAHKTIAELVVGNNFSTSSITCCQSPKFTSNCDYFTNENSSDNSCQSPQQLPSSPRCAVPKDNVYDQNISQFEQFEDHKSENFQPEIEQDHATIESQEQQETYTDHCNPDQILDCDDIMMFNNWDDVRQNQQYDHNTDLFAEQF